MSDPITPAPAPAPDALPIVEKPLEKRPSNADLDPTPKKQKTESPEEVAPRDSDIKAAAVTSAPTTAAPTLLVKKLSDKGRAPKRGSEFAAGYDVYRYSD